MKSLTEIRKTSQAVATEEQPGRTQELFDLIFELTQHVEALQRQIDEMRRHQNVARRAGS